ncbi:aromatic ring-hydroxylating dioxygenase subunit alpha [Paenibacillus hodogayensis]|uniref:Aromatic ring-hydroxylating dioxygenase subunit alpha n=1 Tax=Paenibacillus hodogayensis TaxID=279208 RepID=A0ABV5W036_9BACL
MTNPSAEAPFFQTMPYALYTDPQVYREEKQKIFSRSWNFVGMSSLVAKPGDFYTCEVAGQPIIVTHGQDGVIRAFYNVCAHRATKVEKEEFGSKKILMCSYHGWTYKLDGGLNKTPNFKDCSELCTGAFDLKPIRLEIESSFMFVNLDDQAPALLDTYRDFFEDIRVFSFMGNLKKIEVKKRVIGCNWKVFIDNFLECDHCPIAHPGFVSTLDMKKYHIINGDYCNIQGTGLKAGRTDLQTAEVQEGRFYWLWPNTMVTVYPGPGNISTIQMLPIDHETTMGVYTFYLEGDEPTAEQKQLMAFADQVRQEDVELVELAQVGYRSSAFDRGICSPTEHGVYHFAQLVQSALGPR